MSISVASLETATFTCLFNEMCPPNNLIAKSVFIMKSIFLGRVWDSLVLCLGIAPDNAQWVKPGLVICKANVNPCIISPAPQITFCQ